jgi:hypothetical protein
LVDASGSGLIGSAAVAAGLREAAAKRDLLTVRLSAVTEATPIDLRATLAQSASEFTRMIDELPHHLSDPETV